MQESQSAVAPSVRHTLKREPGSRVVLEVEVAPDRLARATDSVFARHVQHAKIPGFRPGKAPRAMYERTYGRDHLWEEAAEDLVEDTYREILDEEKLEPIDRPDVKLDEVAEGRPVRYTATVVVRPEVTLGDYRAHGVTVEPVPPAEDEIDRTIAAMRESHAQLRPVERPAQKGDVLTVDIDAKVGERNVTFARNAHVEAGKELGITGLGEALVGMSAGEEKKIELTFPSDASEGELTGKPGTFSIRPSQVAEKILPPLDDDFAKTVGVADLAALRRSVKNELAAQAAMSPLAQVDPQALRSPQVLSSLARSIRNRKTVDKLIGLESPDAEREAIKRAGGEDVDFHGGEAPPPDEPKIIIPEK